MGDGELNVFFVNIFPQEKNARAVSGDDDRKPSSKIRFIPLWVSHLSLSSRTLNSSFAFSGFRKIGNLGEHVLR